MACTKSPIEAVHIEVPQEYSGTVIEELSRRKGEMRALNTNEHNITTIEFFIPTRGLMGYRNELPHRDPRPRHPDLHLRQLCSQKGDIPGRQSGVLISNGPGKVTGYACFSIQDRGTLFVGPGEEVYEGMVVGENTRDNDLSSMSSKASSSPTCALRAAMRTSSSPPRANSPWSRRSTSSKTTSSSK